MLLATQLEWLLPQLKGKQRKTQTQELTHGDKDTSLELALDPML
jgi:hypothetical protein